MTDLQAPELTLVPPSSTREAPAQDQLRTVVSALLGVALVASVYADGLYHFREWGVVALIAMLGLAVVALTGGFRLAGPGASSLAGLALLAVLTGASIGWADSADRAWLELSRVLLYLGTFAVGLALFRSGRETSSFVNAVAAAGGLVAAALLVDVALGNETSFLSHRLDAPLDYINGTAGFLLICMWPAIAVAERARHPVGAGLGMAAVAAEANLLVLTQSRAVVPAVCLSVLVLLAAVPGRVRRLWVLLVAGAALAAGLNWTLEVYAAGSPGRPSDPAIVGAAGVASCLATLAAGLAWAAATSLRRRTGRLAGRLLSALGVAVLLGTLAGAAAIVGNPTDEVRSAWRSFSSNRLEMTASVRFGEASGFRYDLWRVAWREFEAEPLTGVGAGSYGLRYFELRDNPESVRQPHSLPLQFLAELGVGGALALVLLLGGVVAGFVRWRTRDAFIAVGCGGLFSVWFVDTSVDWLWNIPSLTCLAMLAAAAMCRAPFDHARDPRSWAKLVSVGVLVVVACASASIGRHYAGERYELAAQRALADDPAEALRLSRRSLEYTPASVEALIVRAAAFARYGDYARARAVLVEATRHEPRNFVPYALLGDLAARRGDMEPARRAYRASLARNPQDQSLRAAAAEPRAAVAEVPAP